MNLKEFLNQTTSVKSTEFIHSGSLALDYIISGKIDGNGGWPVGRVCEVHGDPFSGKSGFALKACAEFQKKYGEKAVVFYDDIEEGVDDTFGKKLGVEFTGRFMCTSLMPERTARLTEMALKAMHEKYRSAEFNKLEPWATSQTAEECFSRIRAICEFDPMDEYTLMFVVDSIAALSCTYEMTHQLSRVDQGQRAKAIKQAMRMIGPVVARRNAILLVTNHDITGPGSMRKDSSSGTGPKYHASTRVYLRRPAELKDTTGRPYGVQLHAKADKTRFVPPYKEAEIELHWETGIDKYKGLVPLLCQEGVIKGSKGWYMVEGSDKKLREKDVIELIEKGKLKL